MLAELLSKENRKGEAIEQLQSLYEKLQAEGRAAEARATVDRMRAIDPNVDAARGGRNQRRPLRRATSSSWTCPSGPAGNGASPAVGAGTGADAGSSPERPVDHVLPA